MQGSGRGLVFLHYPSICLEKLKENPRNTSIGIIVAPAEIGKWQLPRTNQKLFLVSQLTMGLVTNFLPHIPVKIRSIHEINIAETKYKKRPKLI